TFVLASLCVGFTLAALAFALHRAPQEQTATSRAAGDEERLATPDMGVTASGPDRTCLPAALVSVRESAISCGKNGGCHVDIQAQWAHSAHRFSANPAYRRTVRLLIQDVGI